MHMDAHAMKHDLGRRASLGTLLGRTQLQDVEEEVVGQPTPEERGALLLATEPRVEPHGTLQQPEQRSRLPQPLQLWQHLVAPRDVHHGRVDRELHVERFALLEERCLSTRHGERLLERQRLGHILVRGLGDGGERAPGGQLDSGDMDCPAARLETGRAKPTSSRPSGCRGCRARGRGRASRESPTMNQRPPGKSDTLILFTITRDTYCFGFESFFSCVDV